MTYRTLYVSLRRLDVPFTLHEQVLLKLVAQMCSPSIYPDDFDQTLGFSAVALRIWLKRVAARTHDRVFARACRDVAAKLKHELIEYLREPDDLYAFGDPF